jgi:hypothetical protein
VSRRSRWEYFRAVHVRYQRAGAKDRGKMLDEFCSNTGYNRKYAIRLMNGPVPEKSPPARRRRGASYSGKLIGLLSAVWEAAGYPWSIRLKAVLPLWLPWIQKRFHPDAGTEERLLKISAATMDRHLKSRKQRIRKRLYGRTRPGSLLKHQIPIKTDSWNVKEAGFVEVDLVSHSGNRGDGEFIHSLNMTDIYTGWVETRAVLGKGQTGIVAAMEQMRQSLPFPLRGIDSDNGSEFINYHLKSYCSRRRIQFTRGRPYKEDDNAHIEQKNWTHVRKIFGYLRFDSTSVLEKMNDLYSGDLRVYQNLFQPSTKLLRKTRVGSRLRRVYDPPKTPLERVRGCSQADPAKLAQLNQTFQKQDPFELSRSIDRKLETIFRLANARWSPHPGSAEQ